MLSQEIRLAFLNYFKQKQHALISSSPVIPHDDPTLLFINAGMNQFKDVFLGKSFRDYTTAATSQKCIRVGGKHNDLENVGHTTRHLTFFEMLGNFSFGNYFKKEAIQFAWEVSTEVFRLDSERIWPTVFREDDEAFELWKAYVPEHRITRFGEKENFWAMGETGPCGPCSELLYDRGKAFGPAESPNLDISGERYLEFWNLVFMQFNRDSDGRVTPLPKPSIDTGAGLERVVSLRLGVESVFETDILNALIDKVGQVSKTPYTKENSAAFHVIADHLRSLSFAIADGAQPSNLDRGYVLRKILRRACRYGRQLGFEEPFLANILPTLIEIMGPAYPEIKQAETRIAEILSLEEEGFLKTLKKGGSLLNQIMERAKSHQRRITGEDAFKLKDTYGLPYEEIALLAKDNELSVDEKRYQELEKEAKERSRAERKTIDQVSSESLFEPYVKVKGPMLFYGYEATKGMGVVTGLLREGKFVQELCAGEEGFILLDKTPFYAEMGGQVGDRGILSKNKASFSVIDTQSPYKGVIAHYGKVNEGIFKIGDGLHVEVDQKRREKIANNHTATHLLHYALQLVVGPHIKQAGSVVDSERLRFDFSHHKALNKEEIRRIEDIVNAKIRENHPVKCYELSYEEVKDKSDIKQFFGEKYGSKVRVVETGQAKELCGGTHTIASGNIGHFRIEKESSIAAGIRRIEAVTGSEAEALARKSDDLIANLAALLKVNESKIQERIEKLMSMNTTLSNQVKSNRQEYIQGVKEKLLSSKQVIRDVSVIAEEVNLDAEELRKVAEELIQKVGGIILLASPLESKAQLHLRVSQGLNNKGVFADAIIRDLAKLIDGSGGGRREAATAGGKSPDKIPLALLQIRNYVP